MDIPNYFAGFVNIFPHLFYKKFIFLHVFTIKFKKFYHYFYDYFKQNKTYPIQLKNFIFFFKIQGNPSIFINLLFTVYYFLIFSCNANLGLQIVSNLVLLS
jgi:hypothetical protein